MPTAVLFGFALVVTLFVSLIFFEALFPTGIRNTIRTSAVDAGYGFHGRDIGLRDALMKIPGRLIENLKGIADIPNLAIDLKLDDLGKLYAKRNEALDIGFLVQAQGDYVPATVRIDGRSVKVKLRLKGDMVDHIRTDKWSFRIQVKGHGHVFGLRRFSVQHPETRGFQAEMLFLETLRRQDVLAPRYFLVNVTVNGNDVGLMALEEHFSTELLQSGRRPDGVIVRFDESLMWADRVARGPDSVRSRGPFDSYQNAPISVFQQSKVMRSARLRRQYDAAAGLLRAFADEEMEASAVFDVRALGRFLAVAELWGAWHALGWNNQRFYLNPLTMRLEPIGFDAHLEGGITAGTVNSPGTLAHRMLQDPKVYTAFEEAIMKLKVDIESGELIAALKDVQAEALSALRTEFLLLEGINLSDLSARAAQLPYVPGTVPPPAPGPFATQLLAYTTLDNNRSYLELSNPLPHEIEVVDISWVADDGIVAALSASSELVYPLLLPAKQPQRKRKLVLIEYEPVSREANLWLEVTTRLRGQSETQTTRAIRGILPLRRHPIPTGDLAKLLEDNPFLSLSAAGDEIRASTGLWKVRGSLVVPEGFSLRIPKGTTLQFERDAALIAHGETFLDGTEAEPIILEGVTGAGGLWQGVVVHESDGRSHWMSVRVKNTTGVEVSSWMLSGGTTFYRSDVAMSLCAFEGNKAEDALNIIHSEFELDDVAIRNTASDGFDSDFSKGSIRGGSFVDIGIAEGADGLDVSGSQVVLQGARFLRITDNAISVGEGSNLTAEDVSVEDCAIGAVSKDASRLMISNSTISGTAVAGLMSYVKKPEYGPASLIAEGVVIAGPSVSARVQRGSELRLNGVAIESDEIEIDLVQPSSSPGSR